MKQLKPPHNSEWIIAYGQGHQLQWKTVHEYPWSDSRDGTPNPVTHPHLKWRIKPEPVVTWQYAAVFDDASISDEFDSLADAKEIAWVVIPVAYIKVTITDGVPTVEIVK